MNSSYDLGEEVQAFQQRLNDIKWVKHAQSVVPNLPNGKLRTVLEEDLASYLGEGESRADIESKLSLSIDQIDALEVSLASQALRIKRCEEQNGVLTVERDELLRVSYVKLAFAFIGGAIAASIYFVVLP